MWLANPASVVGKSRQCGWRNLLERYARHPTNVSSNGIHTANSI
jgi:hypothetical protein